MGEPVVCLHGFGQDRSVMAAAMDPVLRLRPGLRRIYPDLPGHGESPAGPPDPAGVADAVSAFIDGPLGGGPVLLAGWSYGGYIAATLARRRPAGVTGLLLICAGARLLAPGERELPGPPADPGPGPLAGSRARPPAGAPGPGHRQPLRRDGQAGSPPR